MRNDVYMCDCDCKKKYFDSLKNAKEHNKKSHNGNCTIFYNQPYGNPIEVLKKRK